MVIEITYEHPDDGSRVALESSYEDEPFTVGRSEACTVTLPPTWLSRFALVIAETEDTRLKIQSGQRFGYVQVTRADGERKATLAYRDEFVCGAGTYSVLLRTASEEVLELNVIVMGSRRMVEPGMITIGMWNRKQIFDPTPEEDWRWLAALATVVAQTNARHKGNALKSLATAWHGGNWNANMQGRLDKVLERLGYRGSGIDKQQAIASEVRSSGVIQQADYMAFREEVQLRALKNLSRAEIGLLGWGYLTRGA